MAGDYSRFTFKVDKNYSEVRQQQGRVSLDADWNEGEAIDDRHWRSETFDILGRCVVPATTPDAFEIVPTAPGEFTIGVGRLYLDGLQVENHGLLPEFDPVLGEMHGTGPVPYAAPPGNPMQPYYPTAPAVTLPAAGRNDLIYLHVWQREVTALEDPALLEIALGGPDTTTRLQTAWQVQVLEGVGDTHCADQLDAWDDLIEPSAGRLTTDEVAPGDDKPCIISPAGGYRGLENRLYRVEVHTPGALGTAKFKWSRDNVSVRAAVDAISLGLDQITVRELGRDQVLRFNVGDWVEVLDDHVEFRMRAGENVSGHMAEVTAIDEANGILTISPAIAGLVLDATDAQRHTRVRRWDQSVGVDVNGLLDTAAGPLELEDGVLASFSIDPANPGGEFKRGDFWVFAARTADGSVEQLVDAPPRGIHHHYCRLAIAHWGPTVDTTHVHDCRTIWPPAQCCTIAVRPGEDIQAAIDRVPADGGCVCLLPGLHLIHEPLLIDARQNINFKGVGPASKLIYQRVDAQVTHQAALYVVGGSRDIHVSDMLIYGDSLPHLVVVDEDSQDIQIRACQLINALVAKVANCIILGHCCAVRIIDSRLLAIVDVAQANQELLSNIDAELSAMRPPLTGDGVVDGDDVIPVPEPRLVQPLKHLQVKGNTLYLTRIGLLLLDGLEGHVSANDFQTVSNEDLEPFAKPEPVPGGDLLSVAFEPELFFGALDDQLAKLSPCAPPPVEQQEDEIIVGSITNIALLGLLLHHYQVHDNTMCANIGIQVSASRAVHTSNNQIDAQEYGVYLGYAFDTEVCDSEIEIPVTNDKWDGSIIQGPWKMWTSRYRSKNAAIAVFFTRGFRARKNRLEAQTGVLAIDQPKALLEPEALPRDSLLRVMGIQRLWRVSVELIWFFYQLFRPLLQTPVEPPAAGEPDPKEQFEQRMFKVLVRLLGGRYFTHFVGKAEISDNRMQVTHFGVLFHSILSIGGMKILRNRVSGQRRAGIHVRPWFSVGRVDSFAKWTRCTLEWLLAILALFRDALQNFLDNSTTEEQPDNGVMGWVTIGISWVLVLCSRYCGSHPTDGDDGDDTGETLPTPAEVLKTALDDFLDNLDPTWLDDLVNQAYIIDGNVLAGAGDGIVTGLDGTRISHNQVTIWPATPVPFETVVFGLRLKAQFESADKLFYTSEVEVLAEMAQQADRDALFISTLAAQSWVDALWDEQGYREVLRSFLQDWSAYVNSASPLAPHIQDMADGLVDGDSLNQSQVTQAWRSLLSVMVWELNGYGIVMLGADMDCHHNRVESKTGCGSKSLNNALWGKRDLASSAGTMAGTNEFSAARAQKAYTPLLFTSPGLGGIWQTSNLLSLTVDILRYVLVKKVDNAYKLVVGLVAFLVLYLSKERNQRVNENHVENALVHGIRTMNLYGSDETEVMDNVIRNASRHGIYHLTAPFVDIEEPVTIKVHRNTVLHAEGASAFGDVPGRTWEFSTLIWVENGGEYGTRSDDYGTTLLSLNHGDGSGLTITGDTAGNLQSAAVYVETSVAGVTTNHILSNTDLAFIVQASEGLFTDNIANKGSTVSNPAIKQGPDVVIP